MTQVAGGGLEVARVSKAYATPRGALTVLSDVTFSLAAGDAVAIMGPSGSGKSSLLYILGALEPPTSGTVSINGRNPFALNPTELAAFRNEEVGFVFQDHCLLPQCSVLENVLVPTLVARTAGESSDAVVARARTLIDHVGLLDRIDHRPGELSGGEKQRVAIARALIRQPRLVLCDEPTGNLDQRSAETIADLLMDMHRRQQSVLVVVTHSQTLADRFPERFELANGRMLRSGAGEMGATRQPERAR
jgi:lipoprotein-releasing system ATP-binding protein